MSHQAIDFGGVEMNIEQANELIRILNSVRFNRGQMAGSTFRAVFQGDDGSYANYCRTQGGNLGGGFRLYAAYFNLVMLSNQ